MDGTEALPWSLRLIVGDICGIRVGTGGNSNIAFMTARFCLQKENKKKRVDRERERERGQKEREKDEAIIRTFCAVAWNADRAVAKLLSSDESSSSE